MILVGAALAADCAEPASRSAMALAIDGAWTAFLALDEPTYTAHHAAVGRALPCLREPLPPAEVAQVHALAAGAAFLAGSDPRAVDGLRGAVAADPAFDLPRLPDSHPLRAQLDVARRMAAGDTRPVASEVTVDGAPSPTAPVDRPTFLQHRMGAGVDNGAYVATGRPLPSWAVPPRKRPVALVAATGATAVAAGALYTIAMVEHDAFADAPPDELQDRFDRTNALSWSAVGAGALALGLGTVTVIVW